MSLLPAAPVGEDVLSHLVEAWLAGTAQRLLLTRGNRALVLSPPGSAPATFPLQTAELPFAQLGCE